MARDGAVLGTSDGDGQLPMDSWDKAVTIPPSHVCWGALVCCYVLFRVLSSAVVLGVAYPWYKEKRMCV